MAESVEGVAVAGESKAEAEGEGRDVSFGMVRASGEGGKARAGETEGTRDMEVWPEGLRL